MPEEETQKKKPTDELVQDWLRARNVHERLKVEQAAAELRLKGAASRLGERIAPADLGIHERIGLWVRLDRKREAIVEVRRRTSLSNLPFELTLRGEREKEITS
jgi:hypothetical protein